MSKVSIWIHCNKCFSRFENTPEFYLGKCGHILCKMCTLRGRPLCAVCKCEQNFIPLNANMPSDMIPYFQPAEVAMNTALKVLEFQNKHRDRLLEHMIAKYNHAKKEYMKLVEAYKKSRAEVEEYRAQFQRSNNSMDDSRGTQPTNIFNSVSQFGPARNDRSDFRVPSVRHPRHRQDYPIRGDFSSVTSMSSYFSGNR